MGNGTALDIAERVTGQSGQEAEGGSERRYVVCE